MLENGGVGFADLHDINIANLPLIPYPFLLHRRVDGCD
jgi:hypothetical protein